MTEIKKISKAIIIIIILFVTVDLTIGAVSDKIMHKLPNFSGQLAKDNYRLNRVNKDIVIIGSSRGSHHYVTNMLGDSINKYTGHNYSIYNAAIDGKFINSNSCAAESILKRYTPKLLIFEVGESELFNRDDIKTDIEFSAPHYRYNDVVHSYLDSLGWKEQIVMKSNLYRYNGKLIRMASSFVKTGDSTGYEPLYKVMKPDLTEVEVTQKNETERLYDSYSLKNFTRILKTCQENEVHLVCVSSPRYRPNNDNNYLSELCAQYDIPYIEIYDTELFNNNPQYFQDASHLNDEGAHIYTNIFFQDLKQYIKHLKIVQ